MERIKISDFAEVITGGTPSTTKKEYWDNGTIPWLQSGVCQNCDVNNCDTFITELGLQNSSAKLMPKDTVLIALTGSTTGKVAYLNFEACANQSVTGILPNKKFRQRYIYYYLLSKREKILFDSYGGAQKHISQGYVKNMEIPIKTLDEQDIIINNLSIINNAIELKKQQLVELDNLIKSQFVEMFENEKNYVKLVEVCQFINGDRGKNYPPADEIKQNGDIPFINAGLILNNDVDWVNMNYISKERYEKLSSGKIQRDDILYCLRGSLGKHCIISFDRNGAIASSLLILRVDRNKILPKFLLAMLDTDDIILQQEQANNGSSQPNLSATSVKNYNIKLPSLDKQLEFVNFVDHIDKLEFELKKILEEMQNLFDSLMAEYFE